jgi:hypothetical protein
MAVRSTSSAVAALLLSVGVASADTWYFSGGHQYDIACNSDGYVLTSRYPVVHYFEAGANSRVEVERDVIYMGRSCDAFHKLFKTGSWCWANGGFRADFADKVFGFPRQELSCPAGQPGNDSLGCQC